MGNSASLLFEIARRVPDHLAITHSPKIIQYGELARRVGAIARTLREDLQTQPGDRIALCMDNCAEFFEALFASWTAGLCAVPMNAKLHAKEVAHILDNSAARLCFTTPSVHDKLAGLERQIPSLRAIICTGTDDYERLSAGPSLRPVPIDPTDRAWIFYTSGTTGRPKGAVLTHRNLLFMSQCYYADIDFVDVGDTNVHAAPLSHGSGLYALPHLFKGSHQVILSGSFDPAQIFETLRRYEHVTLWAAPTMLSRLLNTPEAAGAEVRNLKTIIYGGGPMYVADLKRALDLFGPRLCQIYGQGESPMTITALTKAMHGARTHPRYEELLGSCGVARTGVALKVVDGEDRELPTGEIGEVITRSDCVMAEYWANPRDTAETLRGGWLHTGDLGSMDQHGVLTLRDRSKDLIISGGSNVYPREIEEVLLGHPDVLEASVVGRPHPEWGEEVVAFVVARPGASVEAAALDTLCLDNIARFKRPREYRFLPMLPKNNYGKVIKTELRKLLEVKIPAKDGA
jgi:long-chain acyl-CoA synthetase